MADELRITVVGAGRMGRVHVRAIERARSARVAAVVDPDPAVQKELGAAGIRVVAALDQLRPHDEYDAVLIAAPTDLHAELVAKAAGLGLAILCEKPCGLSAEQTRQAAATAETAGVLLQIGYWRRFVPALAELRAAIAAGDLGDLSLISCWQWDERPPADSFRRRSGGIMIDMGVHELDQLRWLTGREIEEISLVRVETDVQVPVDGDPESVHAHARLTGGAVATLSLGRRFPPGDCCWVEAIGTGGYERRMFMWGKEGEAVFLQALVDQIEAFAEAARGGERRGATGHDAVQAIEAAGRASSQGSL